MDWCRGRIKEVSICEHAEKCNEKIDCTSSDDWVKGIFPVYCAGFGEYKCMRDDRGIKMSEAVRKMTREEIVSEINRLIGKNAKLKSCNNAYYQEKNDCKCQVKEMQSHIDCLKAELAEIQMKKQELPKEPIKIANWLIDKYIERAKEFDRRFSEKSAGMIVLGSPIEEFRQRQVTELKQIAEHLLVYCNHAEVE